ncbi:hypothetical protein CBS101457_005354 [Exobasidium rhododendri]|nr:hypothetical protein CBS101457_005354 [Exobasidium rhododendri]
MQSTLFPSSAATSSLSTSSAAQQPHAHAHVQQSHTLRDDSRGSALRQYSDEGKNSTQFKTNGHSNGQQRPASKARRTSSGGSRVPGEDMRQYGGHGGSSASDSGSDWPHGPKTSMPAGSARTSPQPAYTRAKLSEGSGASASTSAAVISTPPHMVDGGKRPERASTSSSYFSKAAEVAAATSGSGSDGVKYDWQSATQPHLDLAKYPSQDLLRILAALLAQIAAANDQLRPRGADNGSVEEGREGQKDQNAGQESSLMASNSGTSLTSQERGRSEKSNATSMSKSTSSRHHKRPTTAALSALNTPSSTLCFHARNVPSISIESYLLRILKYCPATNEVFLSLLIYFDRMSKMGALSSRPASSSPSEVEVKKSTTRDQDGQGGEDDDVDGDDEEGEAFPGMKGFAIDSYNVHRLVIAGVTVASKFFSDVFYTNSRYAKVGGLPVHELNQLELQFLLLNDFDLVIPLEEMQRYADQLLVYGGVPRSTWSDPMVSSVSAETSSHATIKPTSSEAVL